MALHHDREFIEIADEAEARRAAWRISFIGILAVLLLGVGLVSLLLYGRILSDNGVTDLTAPVVVIPKMPAGTP